MPEVYDLTFEEIQQILPICDAAADTHKGTFGRLLCVCGAERMTGAAVMAASAALRCGVGTLCLASVPQACQTLLMRHPEAMTLPLQPNAEGYIAAENVGNILAYAGSCTAAVIGCGLGNTEDTRKLVCTLLRGLKIPILLDADGLNVTAGSIDILREMSVPVILTPHVGEMARLLGKTSAEVQAERVEAVTALAAKGGHVTALLKGAGTLIASQKQVFRNPTGNSGMSKGGSGDVLAGMTGSFLAQGIAPLSAAKLGVYLHGMAGDRAAARFSRRAMLPTDLIAMLPEIFLEAEQNADMQ